MVRRAEDVDRTRERIAAAAVQEHLSVGPSQTSIVSIAAAAGVTRPTVYRHFADMDEIFSACIAHWMATTPQPDPGPWLAIEGFEARASRVLTDVYRWYADHGYRLYPVYRDIESVPPAARLMTETWSDPLAGIILGPDLPTGRAGSHLRAVAMHLVRLMTWRSLVVDGGLSADEAAELGVRWLMAARSDD
ncbi:MAG: TetR/AcrR family transcriptional regulator [Candidatus Limnocylindrales bacterium]